MYFGGYLDLVQPSATYFFILSFLLFCFLSTLVVIFTLSSLRRPPFCIDKKREKNDLRGCTP